MHTKHSSLFVSIFIVIFSFVSTVAAQVQFAAMPDGSKVTPPNSSLYKGRAYFSLDESTQQLWYRVETDAPNVTSIVIEFDPLGTSPSTLFNLTNQGLDWYGVMPALTTQQILSLYKNELYITVNTQTFPQGEIRAALEKTRRLLFSANEPFFSTDLTYPGAPCPCTSSVGAHLIGTHSVYIEYLAPENIILCQIDLSQYYPLSGSDTFFDTAKIQTIECDGGGSGQIDCDSNLVYSPLGLNLSNTGGVFCGIIPASPDFIQYLINGKAYITLHFPLQNIWWQVPFKLVDHGFVAELNSNKVVPPTNSANTGLAALTVGPGYILGGNLSSSLGNSFDVHLGFPGEGGLLQFPGPGALLTPDQFGQLFNNSLYVDQNHTPSYPNGEIRGQIVQNPAVFGFAGRTSAPPLGRLLRIGSFVTLDPSSTPYPIYPNLGNPSFGVSLFDAVPGSFCALAYGEYQLGPPAVPPDPFNAPLDLAPLGAPSEFLWLYLLDGYSTSADSYGCASQVFTIPNNSILVGQDFYLQWLSIDSTVNPLSVAVSEAIRLVIVP